MTDYLIEGVYWWLQASLIYLLNCGIFWRQRVDSANLQWTWTLCIQLTFLMDSNYTCVFTRARHIFLDWEDEIQGGKIYCIFAENTFISPRHKGSYGEQVNKRTMRSRTRSIGTRGGLVCISQYISLWLYRIASLVYSLLAQLFCNLNTEAVKKGIWNPGIVIILTLWCLVRAPGCGFKFWKGISSKARSSCTAVRKYSEK